MKKRAKWTQRGTVTRKERERDKWKKRDRDTDRGMYIEIDTVIEIDKERKILGIHETLEIYEFVGKYIISRSWT